LGQADLKSKQLVDFHQFSFLKHPTFSRSALIEVSWLHNERSSVLQVSMSSESELKDVVLDVLGTKASSLWKGEEQRDCVVEFERRVSPDDVELVMLALTTGIDSAVTLKRAFELGCLWESDVLEYCGHSALVTKDGSLRLVAHMRRKHFPISSNLLLVRIAFLIVIWMIAMLFIEIARAEHGRNSGSMSSTRHRSDEHSKNSRTRMPNSQRFRLPRLGD
jgi:hypothetical protein